MKPTTAEHIQNLENKRAAMAARMTDIMNVGADERPDADRRRVHRARRPGRAGQEHRRRPGALARAREAARSRRATPVPVAPPGAAHDRDATRRSRSRRTCRSGTAFVRAACAKLVCNGNLHDAAAVRRGALGRLDAGSRAVPEGRRRAGHVRPMRPGRGRSSTRTSRPTSSSCCGRRRSSARFPACGTCPFNAKVPTQTAGGTYGWVGEAKPKPVTKLAFAAEIARRHQGRRRSSC